MLIDLDAGIGSSLVDLEDDPGFQDAMSNLALGYREGKHVVTGPRQVLDGITALEKLDERTRGTFQRIKARYQDGQSLLRRVSHFVRVCAEREWVDAEWVKEDGRQTCFRVPYRFFDDSSRIQPTYLVAEDDEDAVLYERAARAHVAHRKLRIEIRCKPTGGGGSSTADRLRASARERFAICIVDSDRDWPRGGLGDTARNARAAGKKLRKDREVAHVFVLPCRTVENLLPGGLVMDALPEDVDAGLRSRCERAREAGILGGGEPFRFLHLKRALWLCDVFAAEPRDKQEFLHGTCQHLGPSVESSTWCQEACEQEMRSEAPCVVFEGLGGTLLGHAVAYTEKQTPHKLAEHLFSCDCGPVWADLGELLVAWTCAFKPLRA